MALGDYTKTVYTESTDVTPAVLNNAEDKIDEIDSDYATHKSDYASYVEYLAFMGVRDQRRLV
jgi:hypothetical protein